MSKSMLIARLILTSGPKQLTLYDCKNAAKKRKVSLNTSDDAAGSRRQGDTCMSKECSNTNEDHKWVYIHCTKPVKHPRPKEATYNMISHDSDSSYTMDPSWLNTMILS